MIIEMKKVETVKDKDVCIETSIIIDMDEDEQAHPALRTLIDDCIYSLDKPRDYNDRNNKCGCNQCLSDFYFEEENEKSAKKKPEPEEEDDDDDDDDDKNVKGSRHAILSKK